MNCGVQVWSWYSVKLVYHNMKISYHVLTCIAILDVCIYVHIVAIYIYNLKDTVTVCTYMYISMYIYYSYTCFMHVLSVFLMLFWMECFYSG